MRYDQTVDVMLLKSMTRNPYCSQQSIMMSFHLLSILPTCVFIVAIANQLLTLIIVFSNLVQNARIQCQNEQIFKEY